MLQALVSRLPQPGGEGDVSVRSWLAAGSAPRFRRGIVVTSSAGGCGERKQKRVSGGVFGLLELNSLFLKFFFSK